MIPRIVHQIWHQFRHNGGVPQEWTTLAQSWRRHHPGWDYRLWKDTDSRRFLQSRYPDLLELYDSCVYPIQRVDMLRYCLLHHFGGVYADMDMECLRPVDELLEGRGMVVPLEPPIHARWMGVETVLSNAFLAASPGHPFLEDILRELVDQLKSKNSLEHEFAHHVFTTTGPRMLTRVYQQTSPTDVHVADYRCVSPCTANAPELRSLLSADDKQAFISAGAYAVHYWANSWSPAREELINPEAHRVDGFLFFPRCDSPGFDLGNAGRNIPRLAEICAARGEAVGFNTDGFVKSRLRPPREWQRSPSKAGNEGLYVKRSALSRPLGIQTGSGR